MGRLRRSKRQRCRLHLSCNSLGIAEQSITVSVVGQWNKACPDVNSSLCVWPGTKHRELSSLQHLHSYPNRYDGAETFQLEVFAVVEIQWTLMIENKGNGLSLDEPHT